MSACAMLVYNNVTNAVWQCIKDAVAQQGFQIASDNDTASAQGFTVHWDYDSAVETLSIQCTDSPFLVPCSVINAKLDELVEACLTQHGLAPGHMVPKR